MRLPAVARVGLKRPNALGHDIPSGVKRTNNVSERLGRVSIVAECATVAVLLGPFGRVIPCNFGLSPEFSTPVEKAVQKQGETGSNAMFR
jgi:hypothetical protein